MTHYRSASLLAGIAILAATCAASADTASSPATATRPAVAKRHSSKGPVLDLIPTLSSSIGGDEFSPIEPPGNPFVRSDVRLSYRLTQPIAPRVAFSYFHNAAIADNTLGRAVTRSGTFVYPQSARDALDDFGFTYGARQGYARAGYAYEHRICCPAAGDPTTLAPAAWHAYYVEGQVHTVPLPWRQLTFSFTERATLVPHHVTAAYLRTLPSGYSDSNRDEYGLTQTLGASLNVAPRTQAFGTFTWGATYFFDNTPFPYQSDTFDYGLQRPIDRTTTLRAEINQQTQRPQGFPFPAPNALHRTKFVLSADVRVGA